MCVRLVGVIFHSTNQRSHWIKDNISNPNLNNSILLKNANLNNSILLKSVSYCYCYCSATNGIFRSESGALLTCRHSPKQQYILTYIVLTLHVYIIFTDERLSSPNSNLFGDMVSVPTSGKQIADERDIFKSLFQSIQLMPALAKNGNSASTISVNARFKYLNVDLVEGGFDNLTKKGKEKESKSPKKSTAPKQVI